MISALNIATQGVLGKAIVLSTLGFFTPNIDIIPVTPPVYTGGGGTVAGNIPYVYFPYRDNNKISIIVRYNGMEWIEEGDVPREIDLDSTPDVIANFIGRRSIFATAVFLKYPINSDITIKVNKL